MNDNRLADKALVKYNYVKLKLGGVLCLKNDYRTR